MKCSRPPLPPSCTRWRALAVALAVALASPAWAADHDEATDGDLSTDPANPTTLAIDIGSNTIAGTVQATGDTRDYVTFTIAPGEQLVSIVQIDYYDVNTSGPGDRGFHAIIQGATSLVPDGTNIGSFLGSNHLVAQTPGTDMLPTLGTAPTGGIGFTPPLSAGDYTYHVQQTGTEWTGYEIALVVEPLPGLPGLGPLGWLGLVGLAAATGFYSLRARPASLPRAGA